MATICAVKISVSCFLCKKKEVIDLIFKHTELADINNIHDALVFKAAQKGWAIYRGGIDRHLKC
jgi:hypothetical protein